MIENIPPKGVSFSDLIRIFARRSRSSVNAERLDRRGHASVHRRQMDMDSATAWGDSQSTSTDAKAICLRWELLLPWRALHAECRRTAHNAYSEDERKPTLSLRIAEKQQRATGGGLAGMVPCTFAEALVTNGWRMGGEIGWDEFHVAGAEDAEPLGQLYSQDAFHPLQPRPCTSAAPMHWVYRSSRTDSSESSQTQQNVWNAAGQTDAGLEKTAWRTE